MTSAATDHAPLGVSTTRWRALLVIGLLLGDVLLARSAILLSPQGSSVAAFWPMSGVSVVALIVAMPRWRPVIVLAIGLIAFGVNLDAERPTSVSASFGLINVVESSLMIWLLTRRGDRPSLLSLGDFARLAFAVLVTASVVAALGGITNALLTDESPLRAARTLFTTHGAALLLIPPLAMRLPHHRRPAKLAEALAQCALLIVMVGYIYAPSQSLPLAFLPFVVLVWGATRLRPHEVVVELVLFATVITLLTVHGNGPLALVAERFGHDPSLVGTLLQLNVLAATLVTLPLTLAASAQLRAIERLDRASQMMDNIVEGTTTTAILGADRAGRIEFFNVGAENLSGYDAAAVVGRGVVTLEWDRGLNDGVLAIHPDREPDPQSLAEVVDPFLKDITGNVTRDSYLRRIDGEIRTISVALSKHFGPDGESAGYVAVANDVTERRRHEQMVEEALAAEKELNDRLAQLDETKNDFLSTVSHELRTPITSIIGYSQLLLADRTSLPDSQGSVIERIERNGRRLMGLIEDMMAMSQFEMADVRFRTARFDLREVAQRALDAVDENLEVRKLVLERELPENPVTLKGDADKLERAFTNLLSNAVKFSREGDRVSVSLCATDTEAVFTVADTGMGINDADLVHLFDRFFRGTDAREMAIQGAGLGLAITHSIVEAHHGRIEVESTLGQGTRFSIHLPVGDPTA